MDMLAKIYTDSYLAFKERQEGATAAEYGLLVALVAVAIIFSVSLLSGSIQGAFDKVSTEIDGAVNPAPAPPAGP